MLKKTLLHLMEAQGLTPEALATRMQGDGATITASAIRSWLSGDRTPTFANAKALATALGCSLDDLA